MTMSTSLRRQRQRRRRQMLLSLLLFYCTVLLSILQYTSATDPFSLKLDDNSQAYCNGGVALLSLAVACGGTDGACEFGTILKLTGSIITRQTLTRNASIDVLAYIEGVTVRQLSRSSNVDLCHYVSPANSKYSNNNNNNNGASSSCSTVGQRYAFGISYNISYMDDTHGWWFQYNNKIGINVGITNLYDDKFAATCRFVLVVKHVYEVYSNNSYSSTPQYYYRILYWSFFGAATAVASVWIGYRVRRKCRVIGLDDWNRMVSNTTMDYHHHHDYYPQPDANSSIVINIETKQPSQQQQQRVEKQEHDEEFLEQVPSTAFQIMKDTPVHHAAYIAPANTRPFSEPLPPR